MKINITRNIAKCSKCGESYEKYRGVNDSRCESCWEPDATPDKKLLGKFQAGEITL
jgi:hypothetical protein